MPFAKKLRFFSLILQRSSFARFSRYFLLVLPRRYDNNYALMNDVALRAALLFHHLQRKRVDYPNYLGFRFPLLKERSSLWVNANLIP
mmetsp:Transcript_23948/g.22983  ORF Transcript_23948/g.22983 Transcript_23948/m.22983 type:complete len:88 (+) Transcript_23948:30-293(+)